MKLYHGTSEDRALAALEGGFLTPRSKNKNSNWDAASNPGYVYLTNAYAPHFAAQAVSLGDEPQRWAIVTVEVDTELLFPDEDWMEQATRLSKTLSAEWGIPDGMEARTDWFQHHLPQFKAAWEESLKGLGNVAHKGECEITSVALFDPRKHIRTAMKSDPTITIMNYRYMGAHYRHLTRALAGDEGLEDSGLVEVLT